MSAPAFTPGPWERTVCRVEGDGQTICVAHLMRRADYEDGCKEAEANARLIAAAPELYALGETAVELIEAELALILESHCLLDAQLQPIRDTLEEDVRGDVERLENDLAQARVLIAKIRGAA